jgi:putative ABC transport system permease protein
MKIFEIISIALASIKANKLRTSLTLIGITVGIFSIIVIMTVLTMLQNSIENGVSMLAKNTFQIQKFPPMMDHHDYERFKNRKDIVIEDYYKLKDMLTQAKYIGAEQWAGGKIIKFMNRQTNPNTQVAGMTPEALKTNNLNVESGREIRENDVEYNNPVVLLGKDIRDKLFPNMDAVGHEVRVDGRVFKVIGTLESQGSMFGESRDNLVVIPLSSFQQIYGKYRNSINITVMTYGKADYNETIEAAIGFMRAIRKVPAGEDNSFDIYSNESLLGQINDMTKYVKLGAIIISMIALLAAGVGIMNIMLVSVTERTREIGIRKAIGARKMSILSQFLIEAITLCLLGGLVGIALGVGIGNIAGMALSAEPTIPVLWVAIGLGICVFVGVLFGTYPAYKASNLDPIEALRYE